MKKQCVLLSGLTIFVFALLVIGPQAYADDTSDLIRSAQIHRIQIEAQLGIVEPPITNVPDDVEFNSALSDHYEQVLIMSDMIDKGIR
jgi:hypothetical protein